MTLEQRIARIEAAHARVRESAAAVAEATAEALRTARILIAERSRR